eukprot:scaffold287_cov337-Pavlova_lutheri.AAC.149
MFPARNSGKFLAWDCCSNSRESVSIMYCERLVRCFRFVSLEVGVHGACRPVQIAWDSIVPPTSDLTAIPLASPAKPSS